MNEELRSTNEELESINDELRDRTSELNDVNDFLESILTSLGVAVAVLDRSQPGACRSGTVARRSSGGCGRPRPPSSTSSPSTSAWSRSASPPRSGR